jgi:ketosteroid isomerase-like protein
MAQIATSNLGSVVNSKLKYFAAAILDSVPYIRMAKAYFKDDVKDKKAGMTYRFFVPDPGIAQAGTTNLDITNDNKDIWERPVEVTLVDAKTSVALGAWNKLTAVEDFIRDICDPHARTLGAEIEADVIKNNWYRADGAVYIDGSSTLTSKPFALLSAKLRGIRAAGKKVGFAHPDVFASLSDNLLGKFLPSEEMKKIYGDSIIAHAFGSDWIEENYMPFITAPDTLPTVGASGTSQVTVNWKTGQVSDSGSHLFEGYAFTASVSGKTFKTVDLNGKVTNEDFVFIVHKEGDNFFIQLQEGEIRFSEDGSGNKLSNPTIGGVPGAIDGTTGAMTGITITAFGAFASANAGKTFAIVQVRDVDALEFDTYEFDEVAGAKNDKLKAMELTVQSVEQGSVMTRNSVMRIDVPYLTKLVLTKLARVLYIKVD